MNNGDHDGDATIETESLVATSAISDIEIDVSKPVTNVLVDHQSNLLPKPYNGMNVSSV